MSTGRGAPGKCAEGKSSEFRFLGGNPSCGLAADGVYGVLHDVVIDHRKDLARFEKLEEVEPDSHKRSEEDAGGVLAPAVQLRQRLGVSDCVLERKL